MFYFIGGAPRAGKTTVAKRLSKELGVPWISTDTLEAVVSEYVAEETFPLIFPKSVLRRDTQQSNDELYGSYSAENIVAAYFEQARGLRAALGAFLASEETYDHSYILEGYHLLPEIVNDLAKKYSVQSIFVGREDVAATLKAIRESTQKNDWVISKTIHEGTFSKIADMLVLFSSHIKSAAEKHDLQYIDVGADFDSSVARSVQYLKSTD